MKIIKGLLLVSLSFLLVNCDPKDNEGANNNDGNFSTHFGSAVSRDFIGRVVDINNAPLQNAMVRISNATVQTDANGVFIIDNADVHERFAYITVTKAGYVDGSRSMIPTSGKNNVSIMMIPSIPVATIASGSEAEVALPSGTKVTFDGTFEDENGIAYSGDVAVSMYHLESTNDNIRSLMPGMLYAETETGSEAVLETYGMMHVELRGTGGQKLQIASGHTAAIRLMIDDSQLATAPTTIPLWHFDEVTGYWKQEGSAVKVGNQYVGEVPHFSWWNCDAFAAMISLTVRVVDSNHNPIANAGVSLSVVDSISNNIQLTDNNGQISGPVPANISIIMKVYDTCGNLVGSQTIGPFSVDTVLPDFVIASVQNTTRVTGILLTCNGGNVTNGYIALHYGNQTLVSNVTNGSFDFMLLTCNPSDPFTLEGIDFDTLQTTGEINYTFLPNATYVGSLTACNNITEFITYQIDDQPAVVLTDIYGSYNSMLSTGNFGLTSSVVCNVAPFKCFFIISETVIPGDYTIPTIQIEATDFIIWEDYAPSNVMFHLNYNGPPGDYIDITFEGDYEDLNGVSHTVHGTVHVIREF